MFRIGVNYFVILTFQLISTIQFFAMGGPLNNISNQMIINSTTPTETNCLRIVSREEWHARECTDYIPMVVSPAPYVVVHHGGIPHYCYDEDTCAKIVRSYQNLHMDVHHWIDIGYHFIIGGDGNVYQGRGWDNVGAHAPGYNGQGIGICIIGDYTDRMPNNASLKALEALIDCGINLDKITPDYKMIGHRQGRATQCPGDTFFKYLQSQPHWTPNPVPMLTTSKIPHTKTKTKATVKTVDITGTSIWTDLIALGEPYNAGASTSTTTTTTTTTTPANTVEENDVDTGNLTVKIAKQ